VIASCHIRPEYYRDSVFLMRAAQEVRKVNGVLDVGVMMGTPANKKVLRTAGLLGPTAEEAGPRDLIVAVSAQAQESADAAIAAAFKLLDAPAEAGGRDARGAAEAYPVSLEAAIQADPLANIAVISVPGDYAAAEARRALSRGLNVFLFSDNVPVAAEVQLKAAARSAGRLVMGPDCGTAVIDGVPLGFANALPRGSVGVIGASGTGMQFVTSLLARAGMGISHAIGTGSRDLTADVAAASTLAALELLVRDPATEIIVLVSKVPAPEVADQVIQRLAACGKPVVANFLGYSPPTAADGQMTFARIIEDVVPAVARLTGAPWPAGTLDYWLPREDVVSAVKRECAALNPGQELIRGLYSGGTLCQEAALVLKDLGSSPKSAVIDDGAAAVAFPGDAHCVIDLGADEFTVGRPHPMIDLSLRSRLIVESASDPRVAVVLFDVVLGYGAHPDPAVDLARAVAEARTRAAEEGRSLSFIASVCGTSGDPQGLSRSEAVLRDAGVVVLPTNAQATRLASMVADRGQPADDACADVPWRAGPARPAAEEGPLLDGPCRVVNIGLRGFYDTVRAVGAPGIHVDWRPPLGGDPALANRLAEIL
jgi:FdrA protein